MPSVPSLLDEPPPRSDATVERWSQPIRARIGKLGKWLAIAFFGIGIGAAVFVIVLALTVPDGSPDAIREDVTLAITAFLFGGALPGLIVRRIVRRDIRLGTALVRNGQAHRARVAKHDRLAFGGMHLIELGWQENGRDVHARFDIEKLEDGIESAEIVVLARPRKRQVAAVFGDTGPFVGLRRRR